MVTSFSDGFTPGDDWGRSFLKRHKKEIGGRRAALINKARSSVHSDQIKMYFEELEKTIQGVPAKNIFNYDETNVADNPGSKIMLYRRGKYLYIIMKLS